MSPSPQLPPIPNPHGSLLFSTHQVSPTPGRGYSLFLESLPSDILMQSFLTSFCFLLKLSERISLNNQFYVASSTRTHPLTLFFNTLTARPVHRGVISPQENITPAKSRSLFLFLLFSRIVSSNANKYIFVK